MPGSELAEGQTTEGLAVAPSLGPALLDARVPAERALVDKRVVLLSAIAVALGLVAGGIAQLLTRLIGLVTNLSFYGRLSTTFSSPAGN